MPLVALTREVSASINRCELSFHSRQPIDLEKARSQHKAYQDCLVGVGLQVVSLAAEPDLQDSVFVEDPALVLDEVAIILNLGVSSRKPESKSLAAALSRYRPLKYLTWLATAEGGDILRIGRLLFVGLSKRTEREAAEQLQHLLRSYGYTVHPVTVKSCLHLKSACSYLGRTSLLVNESWIDTTPLSSFSLIEVDEEEPAAANVLTLGESVIMPASFPKTRRILEERGFQVQTIDVSELQKAEAGVTCCSLIFHDGSNS